MPWRDLRGRQAKEIRTTEATSDETGNKGISRLPSPAPGCNASSWEKGRKSCFWNALEIPFPESATEISTLTLDEEDGEGGEEGRTSRRLMTMEPKAVYFNEFE